MLLVERANTIAADIRAHAVSDNWGIHFVHGMSFFDDYVCNRHGHILISMYSDVYCCVSDLQSVLVRGRGYLGCHVNVSCNIRMNLAWSECILL